MSDLGGDPPYVLCCPDKMRGALTAASAADALCAGVREGGLHARAHPIADGGEGTLDVLVSAGRAEARTVVVADALGRATRGRLGWLPDGTALVETAQAIGLNRLAPAERDVMRGSSAGVGEMVRAALDGGARRVIVTVGGTATLDGGLGAMRELGAQLFDAAGNELVGSGADLLRVERIDPSRLSAAVTSGSIEFALDTWCPLSGRNGTARMFGPQKGAGQPEIEALDRAFAAYGARLGLDPAEAARLGTGGALAAPFAALCGARVRSGAGFVFRETGFAPALDGAIACITAEGRVDRQSTLGKVAGEVVRAAHRRQIPSVVVGGAIEDDAAELYAAGASAVLPIGRMPRPETEARTMAEPDLHWIGCAVARLVGNTALQRSGWTMPRTDRLRITA